MGGRHSQAGRRRMEEEEEEEAGRNGGRKACQCHSGEGGKEEAHLCDHAMPVCAKAHWACSPSSSLPRLAITNQPSPTYLPLPTVIGLSSSLLYSPIDDCSGA